MLVTDFKTTVKHLETEQLGITFGGCGEGGFDKYKCKLCIKTNPSRQERLRKQDIYLLRGISISMFKKDISPQKYK